MASFLVIGLGRFGGKLALHLMELGNEVLGVDRNETLVNQMAPQLTQAKIGDCMDETVLASLGVENFDFCVVCVSDQFQSSLEITSQLKELGAPMVIAKAERDIHARLLKKIGADEVVFPERDMAQRIAMRYSVNGALEYIELCEGYAIFELDVPDSWSGKTLMELDIRSKYNVNIIGIKENGVVQPVISPGFKFQRGTHILVAGTDADVMSMTKQ